MLYARLKSPVPRQLKHGSEAQRLLSNDRLGRGQGVSCPEASIESRVEPRMDANRRESRPETKRRRKLFTSHRSENLAECRHRRNASHRLTAIIRVNLRPFAVKHQNLTLAFQMAFDLQRGRSKAVGRTTAFSHVAVASNPHRANGINSESTVRLINDSVRP